MFAARNRSWALAAALALAGCGQEAPPGDAGTAIDLGFADTGAIDAGDADAADVGPSDVGPLDSGIVPVTCPTGAHLPWREGPFGTNRGDLADSFVLDLLDEPDFDLATEWSGCDHYVFIPDTIVRSGVDATSIWERDLDALLVASPANAHYFFVSRRPPVMATPGLQAMRQRIVDRLAELPGPEADHWRGRLHVIATPQSMIGGWLGPLFVNGHARGGMVIDRQQRIRDLGSLADVTRFSNAANNAGQWPWEANLAYAAYDVRYLEFEALRRDRLAAEAVTVVPLWQGETLAEFAEVDVALPDLAGFDTLEIEVESRCPDPVAAELGNCGAWDYLADLSVGTSTATDSEIARFITSYHRESHWIVDATPFLPLLGEGQRHFRWSFAPPWNTQPTRTWLSLRFSNRGKGLRPVAITPLFRGGAFGSTYNDGRASVTVPISLLAQKVDLVAVITGHGAGTNQCAEFCNHQHELSIGANAHLLEFPEAQTESGCIDQIESGMVPNQAGTWWFGRGGWCPGQQVDPQVIDVTAEVMQGSDATISYRGLFRGQTPPDGSGDINLTSWLVVYE